MQSLPAEGTRRVQGAKRCAGENHIASIAILDGNCLSRRSLVTSIAALSPLASFALQVRLPTPPACSRSPRLLRERFAREEQKQRNRWRVPMYCIILTNG
jgi:hypothetical protein